VRMSENCQKPAFSVANTGSSGTPVQTSRPCGRWVVGVFQGRLSTVRLEGPFFAMVVSSSIGSFPQSFASSSHCAVEKVCRSSQSTIY
ncbi:hypothetical protein VB152_19275, partial [Xanthomonas fragariae]|nr:hypothetical protein [Xanthomonas fragariae]